MRETVRFNAKSEKSPSFLKTLSVLIKDQEQKARYDCARKALDRIFEKGSRHLEEAVIAQLDYAASRKCSAASDKERDQRERREAR